MSLTYDHFYAKLHVYNDSHSYAKGVRRIAVREIYSHEKKIMPETSTIGVFYLKTRYFWVNLPQ